MVVVMIMMTMMMWI